MWTTIYIASGHNCALSIVERLLKEGYLVKAKYFAREGSEDLYEIMVPIVEAEEIQSILIELDIL